LGGITRHPAMSSVPASVVDFLAGRRIAVAGVSRSGTAPANAILRRLRETGHEAIAVNPNASRLDDEACYPNLQSVPQPIDSVMVVTHPSVAADVAREAVKLGIKHVWFHRSFGDGSVSAQAIAVCRAAGIEPIVGGCPLMYCQPADPAHRVLRWLLGLRQRIPT
jgi:uncharacterized protein